MKKLEQSTCGYSSHDRCVHDASVSTLNDDVLIMKTIREITSRGNNAEVKAEDCGCMTMTFGSFCCLQRKSTNDSCSSQRRKDGCQRFYWQNAQNNDLLLNYMTKFSRAYLRTKLYLI